MKSALTACALALTLSSAVSAPPADVVQVGDLVEYTFETDFLGDPGPGSLADLRGKPVLIDFWGTR